jgi:hypothetical protein
MDVKTVGKVDRAAFKGLGEFKLDTMDIAVGIIMGVLCTAVPYYFGFLDKFLWAFGPFGMFANYVALWSWFGFPALTGGWLRRKLGVVYLAYVVGYGGRWLLGDPDGILLIILALMFSVFFTFGFLISGRWRENYVWWLFYAGWVGVADAIAGIFFYGGITLWAGIGIDPWLFFVIYNAIGFIVWGILTGVLGKAVGQALVKAGIARPSHV